MEKMKEVTKSIVESGEPIEDNIPKCVASRPVGFDNEYFNSYSHFGIHHEMLNVVIFFSFLLIFLSA